MRSNLISKLDSFWKSILKTRLPTKNQFCKSVEHLKVKYAELNFQVQYKSNLFTCWMRGWIRLEVEFTKIDFQKKSDLLNKFKRILSNWNILKIVLLGKFCPNIIQLRLTIVLNKYILQIMFESQKRIGTGKKNIYIYIYII